MNRWKLASILSDHADGLNEGRDMAAHLLADYPQATAELAPLFQLASSLKRVLVPVRAPVRFVNQLQQDLINYAPPEVVVKAPKSGQRIILVGVAAAGSVLSVAGLALLLLRRLRNPGKPGQQAVTTAV
jgi:hypothetical protein